MLRDVAKFSSSQITVTLPGSNAVYQATSNSSEQSPPEYEVASYEHLHAYLTKPVDLPQFIDVIESIEHFLLTIAIIPRELQPAF